ncbi:hypothetical protein U6B65_11225 [Oscillospiraceae bacterium MB08-C2-2]|nr:hypothetical protein U6B65_11225 [Oscillospiraceae bacterium MB08-C2-2]
MYPKLLGLLLVMLLATSCSGVLLDTQELLQAPKLNQKQASVYEALEQTLDTKNIVYKYPESGEYHSSFVFFDLDGDGSQEAIVFYALLSEPSDIRVKVLSSKEGTWGSVYDFAGAGDTVDFLRFARLSSQNSYNMVIGWKNGRQKAKSLSVYTFEEEGLQEEKNYPYQFHTIGSFLPGGLEQIVLVGKNSGPDPYSATLLRYVSGRISEAGLVDLSSDTTDILALSTGRLPDGAMGLYIDESFTGTISATEIFRISAQALEPIAADSNETWDLYAQTFRDREEICRDFDQNGVMEIPMPFAQAGVSSSEDYSPKILRYMKLAGGKLAPAYTLALNEDAGYALFLPEEWVEAVTIQRQAVNKESRIYQTDPETGDIRRELLRIRVYSSKDVQDKFVQEEYFLLGTKGFFNYWGYIPPYEGSDPAVKTKEEIRQMFLLL